MLRFWESKFSQVRPMKRGGGRRYYRPEDVDVLKGIRILLYDDGFTIKGVQKVFRERGVRHVAETGRGQAESDDVASPQDDEALGGEAPTSPSLTREQGVPAKSELPDHNQPAAPRAEPSSALTGAVIAGEIGQKGLNADQRETLESLLKELIGLKDRLDRYRSKRNSQRVVSQINLAKRRDLSKGVEAGSPEAAKTKS